MQYDSKPTFQKRHYEAIAETIQLALHSATTWDSDPICRAQQENGVRVLQRKLETLFAHDNPNFDLGRFERACVLGANVRARS